MNNKRVWSREKVFFLVDGHSMERVNNRNKAIGMIAYNNAKMFLILNVTLPEWLTGSPATL